MKSAATFSWMGGWRPWRSEKKGSGGRRISGAVSSPPEGSSELAGSWAKVAAWDALIAPGGGKFGGSGVIGLTWRRRDFVEAEAKVSASPSLLSAAFPRPLARERREPLPQAVGCSQRLLHFCLPFPLPSTPAFEGLRRNGLLAPRFLRYHLLGSSNIFLPRRSA